MNDDALEHLWQVIRDDDSITTNIRVFITWPDYARILLIAAMGTGQTVRLIPDGDFYHLALAIDDIEAFAAGHGLVVDWEDTPETLDATFFIAGAA